MSFVLFDSGPAPNHDDTVPAFSVCTRKTRILDVVYNASNNELVRTKTLVKNAIVVVSPTPIPTGLTKHGG